MLAVMHECLNLNTDILQHGSGTCGSCAPYLTVTVCSWSAGVNTVNVVRERQDMQALVDDLVGIGATVVTTEQDLKQTLKDADLKPPLLG